MKLLKEILYQVRLREVAGSTNVAISSLTADSRKVKRDGLFVAIRGTASDGHRFIDAAIDKGAIAILCEEMPAQRKEGITYVETDNARKALGLAASHFYGNPSEKIKVVGVTGTNGKTTVATLLYKLFTEMGHKAGLLSTVANYVGKQKLEATHTTPDAVELQKLLAHMVDEGCKYAFMEVSSHGLHQHRVAGLDFAGGIFTNITHDHLDYHGDFKNYLLAKKMLFDSLSSKSFALVNADVKSTPQLLHHCKAQIYSYGLKMPADFKGKILEAQINGQLLKINHHEMWTRLVGEFNVYNTLCVFGAASLLGLDQLQVLTTLSNIAPVEGRFQTLQAPDGATGIVDYAHTPDALKNVLDTLRNIDLGNRKIITVIGCGGDRDKTKRPEMARIAADLSHQVVLTSDNPRTEDPGAILNDMEAGLDPVQKRKVLRIENRLEAIRTACRLAQPEDIILVAGKGHEKYQEINGVKHPFDDLAILKEELAQTHKT